MAAATWEVWLDIEAARHAVRNRRPEPGWLFLIYLDDEMIIPMLWYHQVGDSDQEGGVRHEVPREGGEVRENILGWVMWDIDLE